MHAPRKVAGSYSGQLIHDNAVLPAKRCGSRRWRAAVCSLRRVEEYQNRSTGTTPLDMEAQHLRWGMPGSPALPKLPYTSSPNLPATTQSNNISTHITAASVSKSQAELLLARQGTAATVAASEAAAAAVVSASATVQKGMMHIHAPFTALFSYLSILGVLATSSDWYLDIACFGSVWACLWAACCKLRPSARTVLLLDLLPVMHMAGALGMYHWELGNLSWDIIVHTSNGFIGTLLVAACLSDMAAAGAPAVPGAEHKHHTATVDQQQYVQSWKHKAWGVLQLSVLLLIGTSLIEVLEAYGGQLAGSGEGIFLRGAGDFCTAALPCTEGVDTAKDMVDNIVGMTLALVALATGKSSHSKV